MMKGKPQDKESRKRLLPKGRKKSGLSMQSALSYFLKGNILFALNGTVLIAIDSIACIFPSLKIKAGERIALVGPSGCGKSTVLSLVSGLYEPWEGEVLFDGKPRKDIGRMTFVNSVSVINQDVTLFEGTIADNIKMWDESIEDFAMVLASNDAQIHEEIMERPGAYQGEVAERGKNFSGGQRQRIEIATALAKEPTILLMDEGTSALDPKTEAKVMENIYGLGMTLIMIAHRLSTIQECNRIIVLKDGRVAADGNFKELQAQGYFPSDKE